MISELEIMQIYTFDNWKNFHYKFKLNDDGDFCESGFRYYFPSHKVYFSHFYFTKNQGRCKFSEFELKKIIRKTLSLPEFRLRHLLSPYNLVF